MTIATMKSEAARLLSVCVAFLAWLATAAAELAKALAIVAAGFGTGTAVEVGAASISSTPPAVASSVTPEGPACPSP